MEQHIVKILSTEHVTHNVKRFRLEKPANYIFTPGQATELNIHKAGWEKERRPFTFTSLNEWDYLEFTIKIYNDHNGVTDALGKLNAGDEVVIHDVWGAIQYRGEGVFIAGGAGLTPFIAILRQLHHDGMIGDNRLIFSNRKEEDIILKEEMTSLLGDNFINTLTQENNPAYDHEKINADYLSKKITDFSSYFYICGPDAMVEEVKRTLLQLGAAEDKVIIEQF